MLRTTGLAGVLLASLAPPAAAADSDTQLWLTGTASVALGEDVTAAATVSRRFRERALGDDILLLRGTVDWRLSPGVTIGGGLTRSESARGVEWRPHQHLTLSKGRLAWRSQLEERDLPGAPRLQLRLRERLMLTMPVGKKDRIVGYGELLYIVRASTPADKARVDSLRAYLVVQHQLTPALNASAGYLLIRTERPGGPDLLTHAPQIVLAWRF